jgi:hypothetical protein
MSATNPYDPLSDPAALGNELSCAALRAHLFPRTHPVQRINQTGQDEQQPREPLDYEAAGSMRAGRSEVPAVRADHFCHRRLPFTGEVCRVPRVRIKEWTLLRPSASRVLACTSAACGKSFRRNTACRDGPTGVRFGVASARQQLVRPLLLLPIARKRRAGAVCGPGHGISASALSRAADCVTARGFRIGALSRGSGAAGAILLARMRVCRLQVRISPC